MHDHKFVGAMVSKRAKSIVRPTNGCCDLENEVKVKYQVYLKMSHHGKYVGTIKYDCLQKPCENQSFVIPIRLTLER